MKYQALGSDKKKKKKKAKYFEMSALVCKMFKRLLIWRINENNILFFSGNRSDYFKQKRQFECKPMNEKLLVNWTYFQVKKKGDVLIFRMSFVTSSRINISMLTINIQTDMPEQTVQIRVCTVCHPSNTPKIHHKEVKLFIFLVSIVRR